MFPPYLMETLARLTKLEAVLSFFRTRRAYLDGDLLWDRNTEYLKEKKYQNPWEFSATENIIVAFFTAIVVSTTYFALLTEEQRVVFQNPASLYFASPLVFVLLLWLASFPAVFTGRPRGTPKDKKGIAYAILLYHWGARGLFPKLLYVCGFVALFIFVAIQSANGDGNTSFHWLGYGAATAVFVSFSWEYLLLFFSIVAVRKYYQKNFSYLKLLAKAFLVYFLVLTANGIVVALISNLVAFSSQADDGQSWVFVFGVGQIYVNELLNNEEFWMWVFGSAALVAAIYGVYGYISSINKLVLLRASVVLGGFLPVLSGCATSAPGLIPSKHIAYSESGPDLPNISVGILELINNPQLIHSRNAWMVYAAYCLISLLMLSIVDRRVSQFRMNMEGLLRYRSGVSAFNLIFPLLIYISLIFILGKHPAFRPYDVRINTTPSNAEVFVNGEKFQSPHRLYRGSHQLTVTLDGHKPIIGSFYVAGEERILNFKLYRDSDGDGVWDKEDQCPATNSSHIVDHSGCKVPWQK